MTKGAEVAVKYVLDAKRIFKCYVRLFKEKTKVSGGKQNGRKFQKI